MYAILSAKCPEVAPRFLGFGSIAFAPSLAVELEGMTFLRTCRANCAGSAVAQLRSLHA